MEYSYIIIIVSNIYCMYFMIIIIQSYKSERKQFLMLSNIAHRELEKMEVKVNSLGSSQGLKLVIINLKNCPDQYNSCTTFFYS